LNRQINQRFIALASAKPIVSGAGQIKPQSGGGGGGLALQTSGPPPKPSGQQVKVCELPGRRSTTAPRAGHSSGARSPARQPASLAAWLADNQSFGQPVARRRGGV